MSTTRQADSDQPLVDIRDMILVHTAMLREFRLAPAAVGRTCAADRKRAALVADHLRFIGDMLHHHHQGEDELLWPKLRSRVQPNSLAVIDEVEAQHEVIDASLSQVKTLIASWAEDPTVANRDSLAHALKRLHSVLADHLDLEERALLPPAAMVLTIEEWEAVGASGSASLPKSAMPLVIGMFAYEGDPAVLADMLKAAPLPIRTLIPMIAPRVYARRARRIHGSSRP